MFKKTETRIQNSRGVANQSEASPNYSILSTNFNYQMIILIGCSKGQRLECITQETSQIKVRQSVHTTKL